MNHHNDSILSAAQKNRPDQIRLLVETQDVPVNHTNAVGQSALHIACLWGQVEAVQTLLELGASVNAVNQLGQSTPMHMAVTGRQVETIPKVIDLLLQFGANVNIADAQGRLPIDLCPPDASWTEKVSPAPPLWYTALQTFNFVTFQTVVLCDNDKHQKELVKWHFRGQSVLECMFQIFVEQNCDEETIVWPFLNFWIGILQQQSTDDTLSIHNDEDSFFCQYIQQCRPQSTKMIELLKPFIPVDVWQWLQRSARKNDLSAIQYCLQVLHIDPNLRGRQGMTALQFAARSGQLDVLQYLLNCPTISIQITDDRGQTPLDAARSNQQKDAIVLLEQKLSSGEDSMVPE